MPKRKLNESSPTESITQIGTKSQDTDYSRAMDVTDLKSADPITYDDDGNVIPISERFNPEEDDIRHSRVLNQNAVEYAERLKGGSRQRWEIMDIFQEMADAQKAFYVPNEEEERLARLVAQAARDAGYDSPKLYHGTGAFGFTEFDLEKGEHLIFAANKPEIAKTYVGETKRNKIAGRIKLNVDMLPKAYAQNTSAVQVSGGDLCRKAEAPTEPGGRISEIG